MNTETKKIERTLIGIVVSDKMQKTVVVAVPRFSFNRKYRTQIKRTKKFKAHDEKGEYKAGDKVEIAASRPLSREKRWKVVRLVERPKTISVE